MKATPEQWHELERHSHSSQPWAPCILELRARVEALEAANSKPAPNDRQIRSSDITPPPELVQQWVAATESNDCIGAFPTNFEQRICTAAAQWGAEVELEACCEWLDAATYEDALTAYDLRAARRPKPPSLKEQALETLQRLSKDGYPCNYQEDADWDTIRRALEALPE